jgi:hypothetical protein
MNKKRLIEWGKTLLILALTVSAVQLSGVTSLVQQRLGTQPLSESITDSAAQASSRTEQAAKPLTIVITTAEKCPPRSEI